MKKLITLLFIISIFNSCKKKTERNTLQENETITEIKKNTDKSIAIVKYINAKSGLRFRDAPKGKSLGKFKYKKTITIIEKTGITDSFIDNGIQVTGEWVGVKHHKKTVYLFDGFLATPKKQVAKVPNPIDEAVLEGYIIKPGHYHKNEIPDKITTQNWLGLFKEESKYTIETTSINITNIHDTVLDLENKKTGKKIVANNTKECYLLMNNLSQISEREITPILTESITIHPEKPYTFQMNNTSYTLSSTADEYDPLNLNINYFKAKGYKLYLKSLKNETKQLLLAQNEFHNQMIQILFIGDLDGDNIPDVLIDSSNHFNKTTPTLYLSKEAPKKDILKIVSLHISVGS